MNLTDWTGLIGVAILLLAFFMNLYDLLKKDSVSYLLLNSIGAGVACLASVLLEYWPFIILEGCWTLVSLLGLFRVLKTRQG